MRILFVTMQYGPGYGQGTERYLSSLGACLRTRGHEVSYLAGDPLGRERRGGDEAFYVHPTCGWMAVDGIGEKPITARLKAYRPDIIHLANPAHIGAGIVNVARRLDIPVVVTTMDFWWVCPKATLLRADGSICDGTPDWRECTHCLAGDHPRPYVRRLGRLPRALAPLTLGLYYARAATRGMSVSDMGRWPQRRRYLLDQLNKIEHIIFPSRATCEAIAPKLDHDRWQIIPYGLSEEWFEVPRPRSMTERQPEAFTVGYAGALLPHKGPHLLLQAIRKLGWTRTRVRLAGPLNDSAYVRLLKELAVGLNVEFTGSLSPEAMRPFLRSLDALAMTSTWPENLPFIVLEAQAAGVPVVGSRLAGVADQIGSEHLLFEPGSVEGLAAALDDVRQFPQSVPAAKVHTVDEMTDKIEAVYSNTPR